MKNFQNKTNIVRVSNIIRNFLFAALVGCGIAIPVALFPAVTLWNVIPAPGARYAQWGLPLLLVVCFIVTLKLFRFFDRLKNGHLFDAQTVGELASSGKWLVALWLFESLFFQIGHEFFGATAAWNSGGFFAGLTLIFVAWLLKEAQGLQEDQALTV